MTLIVLHPTLQNRLLAHEIRREYLTYGYDISYLDTHEFDEIVDLLKDLREVHRIHRQERALELYHHAITVCSIFGGGTNGKNIYDFFPYAFSDEEISKYEAQKESQRIKELLISNSKRGVWVREFR